MDKGLIEMCIRDRYNNSRQITNHAREAVFTRGKYDEVPILQL